VLREQSRLRALGAAFEPVGELNSG
jgi:hypothetical protein